MTFDPAKVPGGDVARWGEECRAKALAGVDTGDWRSVHDWTRSWVGWGGGAWLPDSWLLYAVSALLKGEPRNAVHSLDLGVRTWLEGPKDRAALTWCRGAVVWRSVNDPKTALVDLEAAEGSLPSWLADGTEREIANCREAASTSRKRVPAVKPQPVFSGPELVRHTVAPPSGPRSDGDQPLVWEHVKPHFYP